MALGRQRQGAGHLPQISLSPCAYLTNSEKKMTGIGGNSNPFSPSAVESFGGQRSFAFYRIG